MEDDDLDELLDEVESTFLYTDRGCRSGTTCSTRSASTVTVGDAGAVVTPTAPACAASASRAKQITSRSINYRNESKRMSNDLDAMIDDIFDDEPRRISSKKSSTTRMCPTSQSKNISSHAGTQRCFPVFLGGSSCAQGLGTTIHKRTCDRLRCTACDFQVSIFDDFRWHASTDYLFLRNNMPDFERLSAKLDQRKGCRAYSCQCSWQSATKLVELQTLTSLKWVCGRH